MQSYFRLKENIIKTLDFFDKKYIGDIDTAIMRTYSESVFGYDILEYRIRLVFLLYAIVLKEVNIPNELIKESIENFTACKAELKLLKLNAEEENDLLIVIDNVAVNITKIASNCQDITDL